MAYHNRKVQLTELAVFNYTKALEATYYDVRLIDLTHDRQPIMVEYSLQQLLRATGYLKLKNREGYNIYCRPIDSRYILLDDLKREVLEELASTKPCMLVETSPGNYQAWLKLEQPPGSHDQGLLCCRALARRFGADLAAARPGQVGRLPGFTNRKAKYQRKNGFYPYVKLLKWADRCATVNNGSWSQKLQDGGAVHQISKGTANRNWHQTDQSRKDFAIACQMVRKKKTNAEITIELEKYLNMPGRDKKRKNYIKHTIEKARATVEGVLNR